MHTDLYNFSRELEQKKVCSVVMRAFENRRHHPESTRFFQITMQEKQSHIQSSGPVLQGELSLMEEQEWLLC